MKKLFAVLAAATMLLSGCASNQAEAPAGPAWDEEVDVLIVGAGGSGMTAAIEAKTAGAEKVLVIEKQEALNGVTYLCEGILSGYETKLAKKYDVHYTAEDCYNQMMNSALYAIDPDLTWITAEQCGPLIDWLADEVGVPFKDEVDQQPFYGPNRLLHYVEGGGAGYREPFTNKLNELGVELRFNNKAVKLVGNDAHDEVIGAEVETPEGTKTIKADSVVLCTGGYANSTEMIQRMNPRNRCLKANHEGGATGDAMIMASEFGALLHNQDEAKYGLSDMNGSSYTFRGTIQIGQDGKRFRDEKGHPNASRIGLHAAMNRSEVDYIWAFGDANHIASSEYNQKAVEKNKSVVSADTIEELAVKMEIDPATLQATVDAWNESCDLGFDKEHGRYVAMDKIETAPYYALKLSPLVGMSYGGVVRNEKGEVIKVNGNTIPGLYVAGEAAEGANANGWTCSHALTWGRIAGKNAAAYAMSK